jgi:hypothetical protein
VFWAKRLEGTEAKIVGGSSPPFEMGPVLQPATSLVNERAALISVASALHSSKKRAFVGQSDSKGNLDKLPGVYVETGEPLVKVLFSSSLTASFKATYLNELDVRKPLVVSISQRSEEL